ncbi:hypothetical protein jhhlp_008319 [Lomentospora prolificans]|uniref:Uncharacterized protein n=1 Tax=Lomentospora prolificans TaxID=41688 RepID=A0A2N3MXQ2_9PEZI|nr:hypothetical protein jhhlp_008319 [Lomentospora prolificans]
MRAATVDQALLKLSQIQAERGREAESKDCRERALALRDEIEADVQGAPVEEGDFSKLYPWMLW